MAKKEFKAEITLTWTEEPDEISYKWDDKNITSEITNWLTDLGFKVELEVKNGGKKI
tara:strand:- start:34 stop:204 length:171 start_codon:yes stop_codon:yes gene_type:complete